MYDSGRKTPTFSVGLGIGYVSIMLVFAVICLTIFAVLSFQAAYSDNALSLRGAEHSAQYYSADTRAKEILAELDGCAAMAAEDGFFEDTFEEYAREVSEVRITRVPEGFRAEYSVAINERSELAVRVVFFGGGRGYEISRWQSRVISDEADEQPLGVWDGSF